MPHFTLTTVLYGDHLPFIQRCIASIRDRLDCSVAQWRIGMNEVSPRVREWLLRFLEGCGTPIWIWDSPVNRLKYPLLRRMLYEPTLPLLTPYVMHFDDDSALITDDKLGWWRKVRRMMENHDLLGSTYSIPVHSRQAAGIAAQPWYTGKPIGERISFVTGGWWCARAAIMQQWNYPWPELEHNGGDVMLGALCQQQGLRVHKFREGLWINADAEGRESRAPRRGASLRPLWVNYDPAASPDLSHQEFELHPALLLKSHDALRTLAE